MDELLSKVEEATNKVLELAEITKALEERVENIEEALRQGVKKTPVRVEGATPEERLENFATTKWDNPEIQKWQDLWDAYTVFALVRARKGLATDGWLKKRFMEVTKALTGADLPNYIPTTFSARLLQLIRLQPSVHRIFEVVDMPSEIYKPPVQLSGISVVYVQAGSPILVSSPTAGSVEFRAKKLAAAVEIADEVTEDSIVPIVPTLQQELAFAFADALDKAILLGDTTSNDALLKVWDGLIKRAGTPPSPATFDAQAVREALASLDIVNPNEAVVVVNPEHYGDMLGWAEVHTVDKYGAQATVVTGELAKIYGMPVVVSPHATSPVVVLHRAFKLGQRRGLKVEVDRDIKTQVDILVATLRADFVKVTGTKVVKLALR